jgi:hypothetical protein
MIIAFETEVAQSIESTRVRRNDDEQNFKSGLQKNKKCLL